MIPMREAAYIINRITQMPPKELAHRVERAAHELLLRGRGWLGAGTVSDDDFLASLNRDQSASLIPKSFAFQYDRAAFVSCYRTVLGSAANRSLRRAEGWLAGHYPLFGKNMVEMGPRINWHRDPLTGETWPSRFGMTVLRKSLKDGKDPKPIWEVNFHHHLVDLVKAYWLTGDERYATSAINSLLSWIEQNPPENGIHWTDSSVIGIRVIVWLLVLPFLSGSNSLTPQAMISIRKSLWAQVRHIERFLSTYTSPNTHLIGEATAMFLAGLFLPDHKEAARWKRTSQAILEEAIMVQFSEDGFYRERSIYYHCYAIEFYLLVLRAAQMYEVTLKGEVWQGVERALEALMHMTKPNGALPFLGDADGGRILKLDEPIYETGAGLLCAGSLLFDRSDFKFVGGAYREEALWLWGPESYEQFLRLPMNAPSNNTHVFQDSGLVMDRTGWDSQADAVFFAGGNMGMLSSGHTHADCLSIEVSCFGRPMLVDPGTYVYGQDASWRDAFRSTAAHNTVTVDQLSQAEPGGTFNWFSHWRASAIRCFSIEGLSVISASHDGYTRLPSPVRHHRSLVWRKPEYFLCVDYFEGDGRHDYEWGFHFTPGAHVVVNEKGLVTVNLDDGAGLALQPVHFSPDTSVEVQCGTESPGPGWYSATYGEKIRAPFVRVRESIKGPCLRAHVLVPYMSHKPLVMTVQDVRAELGGSSAHLPGVACSVEMDAFRDLVLYSPGVVSDWSWNGLSARAELVMVRRSLGGRVLSIFVKRASDVAWLDQVRVQSGNELDYLQIDCCDGSLRLESKGKADVKVWNSKGTHAYDWAVEGLKRVCVE